MESNEGRGSSCNRDLGCQSYDSRFLGLPGIDTAKGVEGSLLVSSEEV